MAENDMVLLKRFATAADADAFTELVRRYVRMVYSTSWRVLKHESDAADVTQQTFFELTRRAGRISGSLSGWLHRVATQKSIDLVRRRGRRRRREQAYTRTEAQESPSWKDLSGHVDEALDRLDESLKALLLEHFLAGKTTSQIAAERGVSQATVSRRVNEGLEQLRGLLRRQGLLVTAAGLGALLLENSGQAVPAVVVKELSKMAMVGTTGAGAGFGAAAAAVVKTTGVKFALLAAAGAGLVAVAGYVYHVPSRPPAVPPSDVMQTSLPMSSPPGAARSRAVAGTARTGGAGETADEMPAAEPPAATDAARMPLAPKLYVDARDEPQVAVWGGAGFVLVGSPPLDMSSPEGLARGLMTLVGEGAMDQMDLLRAKGARSVAEAPFLGCLGYPMELTDIERHDAGARVTWHAAVQTEFSWKGETWSPGESVTLAARLVRAGDLWKLASIRLAGDEDGYDSTKSSGRRDDAGGMGDGPGTRGQ
jgi:RNA polymerase sigma factor (sigma-70 family)